MIVNWYGMTDVKGWEDICDNAQQLLPSLYNKDKEGAWRMDVNVELCDLYDSDNDDCDGYDDESISDDNEMSEEEDNSDDSKEVLSDFSKSDSDKYRSSDK